MMNPYLARFQDQPALVAAENRAWFESCLMAAHQQMESVEAQMNERADGGDWWGSDNEPWLRRLRPYVVVDGILQIPVKGVLLHDFPYQLYDWATGYDYIWRAFERGMGDLNVRGIALVVDSPGGMVAGCFECVDRMFALRGNKPVAGFASESAYSAAYAVISVADPGQITVTRTGGVGSIGVVTVHVDYSKALDQAGVVVTFIYSGAHKVDGNPYEPLPAAVRERIQARVDDLREIFVSTVARNRPKLSADDVRATEALTYGAPESLSIGLADKIGAFDDALADFTASLNPDEGDETMADYTKAQYDEGVAAARNEGIAAGKAEGIKEGATAMQARISAILDSEEAKTRPAAARMLAFDTDKDAESARASLAKLPAEQAAAPTGDTESNQGAGKGKDRFDASMDATGNPNLGAPGREEGNGEAKPSRAARAYQLRGIKLEPKGSKAA